MQYVLQVIEGGPGCDGPFDLAGDRLMVGRGETADIDVRSLAASKNHALLTRSKDGYVIEDWQSRSGTYVNDVQIREPVLLNDGDIIQMAKVRLVYRCANGDI